MKHVSISFAFALTALALASMGQTITGTTPHAKAGGAAPDPTTGTSPTPPTDQDLEPALPVCSDGQIAAIVRASNQAEVDVSTAVIELLANDAAREVATMIIEDHTAALQQLDQLVQAGDIEPVENDVSKQIDVQADQAIEALSTLPPGELDRAYLAQQLLAHLQTISAGDHVLLPSVKNPALAEMLRAIRPTLVQHTTEVTEAQADLGAQCGGQTQ